MTSRDASSKPYLGLEVVLILILVGVGVEGPDPCPLDDLVQDDAEAVDVARPGEHPGLVPQVLGGSPQLALVILVTLPKIPLQLKMNSSNLKDAITNFRIKKNFKLLELGVGSFSEYISNSFSFQPVKLLVIPDSQKSKVC